MLRITQNHNLVQMFIKMNFDFTEICDFLASRGYTVKSYQQTLPAVTEFLVSEPSKVVWTFTATKDDEAQSDKNLYLKVFEREVKRLLGVSE